MYDVYIQTCTYRGKLGYYWIHIILDNLFQIWIYTANLYNSLSEIMKLFLSPRTVSDDRFPPQHIYDVFQHGIWPQLHRETKYKSIAYLLWDFLLIHHTCSAPCTLHQGNNDLLLRYCRVPGHVCNLWLHPPISLVWGSTGLCLCNMWVLSYSLSEKDGTQASVRTVQKDEGTRGLLTNENIHMLIINKHNVCSEVVIKNEMLNR